MKLVFATLLTLALTACGGKSYHEDYGDYEGTRNAAAARCDALGYLPGSPESRTCVAKEYTRIRGGR